MHYYTLSYTDLLLLLTAGGNQVLKNRMLLKCRGKGQLIYLAL